MKKYIELYHYSNEDFIECISPRFFACNCYTQNSKHISNIPRSYFYTDKDKREPCFYGAKYRYTATISLSKLYDLCADKDNLRETLQGKDVFSYFKSKGYSGLLGNNGIPCVCLFEDIKYIKKDVL